jgi:hypothetical protein
MKPPTALPPLSVDVSVGAGEGVNTSDGTGVVVTTGEGVNAGVGVVDGTDRGGAVDRPPCPPPVELGEKCELWLPEKCEACEVWER